MKNDAIGIGQVFPFKESLNKAIEEERYDDVMLLLANRMRSRHVTVSTLARNSIPIDAEKIQPIKGTRLTQQDIEDFDIRDKGWHLIALRDQAIIGAERLPRPEQSPQPKQDLAQGMEALLSYYGEDALVLAAYHCKGLLVQWEFLCEFDPRPVQL